MPTKYTETLSEKLNRLPTIIRPNWWIVVLTIVVLISVLIWVGYERLVTGRVVLTIVVLILVSIMIWIGYKLAWTGFGTKTLWDWMQLLIIPAVLAGGAYWLNESARQSEQAIADDNLREAALQTYIDRMAELLIKENLSDSEVKPKVRAVARARTLTVLRRLDKERKGALLRFLYEADLIQKDKGVIDLRGADLREADLTWAKLSEADLSGVNLGESKLSLDGVILREADLSGARYNQYTIWPESFNSDAAGAIRVND